MVASVGNPLAKSCVNSSVPMRVSILCGLFWIVVKAITFSIAWLTQVVCGLDGRRRPFSLDHFFWHVGAERQRERLSLGGGQPVRFRDAWDGPWPDADFQGAVGFVLQSGLIVEVVAVERVGYDPVVGNADEDDR